LRLALVIQNPTKIWPLMFEESGECTKVRKAMSATGYNPGYGGMGYWDYCSWLSLGSSFGG